MSFLGTLITCIVMFFIQYFSVHLCIKWNKGLFWDIYGDIVLEVLSKDIKKESDKNDVC